MMIMKDFIFSCASREANKYFSRLQEKEKINSVQGNLNKHYHYYLLFCPSGNLDS